MNNNNSKKSWKKVGVNVRYYIDGMRIEEEEFYDLLASNSKKDYSKNFGQLEYYGSININGIEFSMNDNEISKEEQEEEIWFNDYN